MMNDRRLLIKGTTDFSIPESHLMDMHALVNERNTEVAMMSETIAALKLEDSEASYEINKWNSVSADNLAMLLLLMNAKRSVQS